MSDQPADLMAALKASLVRGQACEACTGDGGEGHTLRGACAGAPCPACGEARYRHLPGECDGRESRSVNSR